MTNQVQGEIIFAGWTGSTEADWVYTPWMPVRADFATFGVQIVVLSGIATVNWGVETRTAEDPTATPVFTTQSLTTATVGLKLNTTACKQLVRYRINTDAAAANTTNFVILRALAPSWQADR